MCTGHYTPNFEEVDRAYWFRVVPSVRQEPCMLGFRNFISVPHGKIADTRSFSCPSYLPFWSYAPFKKIRMKSDAYHILLTVHARVLKFHIWITHGKITDPYFFLDRAISLSGVISL